MEGRFTKEEQPEKEPNDRGLNGDHADVYQWDLVAQILHGHSEGLDERG